MDPYSVTKLPDEPIILAVLSEAFKLAQHQGMPSAAISDLLDAADEPCYLIIDLLAARPPTIEQIIPVANRSVRGTPRQSFLRHANMREFLIVTESTLFAFAARSLQSDVFGNINVQVFATRDEALAYARSGA
jgi:hypothetical protein